MHPKKSWLLLPGVTLAAITLSAQAALAVAFITPIGWTRGDPGSTTQHWDAFTTDTGATPDVVDANPHGTATLSETGPGFATGSGNLYSFGGDLVLEIDVPDAGLPLHQTSVLLQVATEGGEIQLGTVLAAGLAPIATVELFRGIVSSPFGDVERVEMLFEFLVPTAALVDIDFGAAVHTSVAEVSVDTLATPIPEPGTATLMLLGLSGIAIQRRGPRRR